MLAGIDYFLGTASRRDASIRDYPNRIAVFGGALSSEAEIASANEPKSMRDSFIRWARIHRVDLCELIILPESYEDWSSFDNYTNLLSFEEDLGYVTSAVVIFLEAPGSIAELGAFCQMESLSDQLIVVVPECHHPKKSFISLGPLRRLEQHTNSEVCVIEEGGVKGLEADIELVTDAIDEKLKRVRSAQQLQHTNEQHRIVLALDAITLLSAATFSDVKATLEHFGVQCDDARVRQILYTLQNTQLIRSRRVGGTHYYSPVQWEKTWVEYRGESSGTKFNRRRVAAKISELLRRNPAAGAGKALAKASLEQKLAA